MTSFLRHFGTKDDPRRKPDFDECPVEIPDHWTELVGDYCGQTLANGDTCWHNGLCGKCYRCPCHCTCPPPHTAYELAFMEQTRHYYDSGRD